MSQNSVEGREIELARNPGEKGDFNSDGAQTEQLIVDRQSACADGKRSTR